MCSCGQIPVPIANSSNAADSSGPLQAVPLEVAIVWDFSNIHRNNAFLITNSPSAILEQGLRNNLTPKQQARRDNIYSLAIQTEQ